MFFWRIDSHMVRLGWANARQLSLRAGISYPVAWQIVQGGPVGRIDTATLSALARAFGCDWWTLLEYVP